jgi:hypothetical protein
VTLLAGSNDTPFLVHRSILCQSAALAAQIEFRFRAATTYAVTLDNMDAAAAHVLVHYLYTQQYMALDADVDKVPRAYALATRVYFAAIRYGLRGLTSLAKTQIELAGLWLRNVEEMLRAVRECAFPELPEGCAEEWFTGYLEKEIRKATLHNPTMFRKPGFLACVEGNLRLLQIVWGTVLGAAMEPQTSKSAGPEPEPEPEPERGEDMSDGKEDVNVESNPLTPVFSAPDSVPAADDALRLDTIEPVDSESPASSLHVLEDDKMAAHARSDSVVQMDDAVADGVEKAADLDLNNEPVTKKKPKKDKKKKKLSLLPMGV